MASTDATLFPVYGQAYRFTFCIVSVSTLNPITGGLTGLAATVSKDGAAFATTTNAPVEIGTTGFFTLDLTATEMTAYTVALNVTASNANAVKVLRVLNPAVMTEPTGRYDAQSVVRVEQLLTQLYQFFHNYQGFDAAGTTYNVYKKDSATLSLSATLTETSTSANHGKFQ